MGHLKTSNCTASTSIATTAWMEEEKEVHHDGRPRQQTIVQIFIDFAVANTLQCTVPPIAEYLQATDQTNDDTIEMLRAVRGPTKRTYRYKIREIMITFVLPTYRTEKLFGRLETMRSTAAASLRETDDN